MDTQSPLAGVSPLQSDGTWRTLGCIIAGLGELITFVPDARISVWGNLVMQIGAAIGGAGVIKAIPHGTLFNLTKKED